MKKYAKKIPKNHLYSRTTKKISDNILKKQAFLEIEIFCLSVDI